MRVVLGVLYIKVTGWGVIARESFGAFVLLVFGVVRWLSAEIRFILIRVLMKIRFILIRVVRFMLIRACEVKLFIRLLKKNFRKVRFVVWIVRV